METPWSSDARTPGGGASEPDPNPLPMMLEWRLIGKTAWRVKETYASVARCGIKERMMPVEALDHVQLAMPPAGEEWARRFYAETLGIPEVSKPPQLAARGGCWFERGPVKIHLGVEPDFQPARKAHPALVVSDLPSLIAQLAAAGHPVRMDPPLPGCARCYVDDPFGNRIELMELDDPRPR